MGSTGSASQLWWLRQSCQHGSPSHYRDRVARLGGSLALHCCHRVSCSRRGSDSPGSEDLIVQHDHFDKVTGGPPTVRLDDCRPFASARWSKRAPCCTRTRRSRSSGSRCRWRPRRPPRNSFASCSSLRRPSRVAVPQRAFLLPLQGLGPHEEVGHRREL
jgi:hypothetical protein